MNEDNVSNNGTTISIIKLASLVIRYDIRKAAYKSNFQRMCFGFVHSLAMGMPTFGLLAGTAASTPDRGLEQSSARH